MEVTFSTGTKLIIGNHLVMVRLGALLADVLQIAALVALRRINIYPNPASFRR